MDRRSFLSLALAGGLGAVAGCVSAPSGGTDSSPPTTTALPTEPTPTPAPPEPVESVAGFDLPVSRAYLDRGAGMDGIPAIVDPAFATDWGGLRMTAKTLLGKDEVIEPRLRAEDRVIGVERGGEARAYPLRVLNWHEVVNDDFRGPLLVTYCPLCGSGVTAVRTVDGEETVFGVSGLLWNSDLVMYDALTQSLWSQIAATAIRGPRTGQRLALVPSTFTTWGTWREDHPETTVLLPPPESNTVIGSGATRDYRINPFEDYEASRRIGTGDNELPHVDFGLHPKASVIGVAADGQAKAYPLETVREAGVINDRVGDRPVAVSVGADGETLVAYVRRVEGDVLRFERVDEDWLRAGGSRWGITTGRAADGPHEGATLERASENGRMFWFAWLDFHPDTAVFGREPIRG